jgi:hypothetical protein
MDAQSAARRRLQPGDAVICLGNLMQDLLNLAVEDLTGFREVQPSAGAVEQAAADILLERVDDARHGSWRKTRLPRSRRKAAQLDDVYEKLCCPQPLHGVSNLLFIEI